MLPTEAEWEYACRAGTKTRYYNGNNPDNLFEISKGPDLSSKDEFPDWVGSFLKHRSGYPYTAPVGQYRPNEFGLYDMIGNVWEWCYDWYGKDYYSYRVQDDPTGPKFGGQHVLRGGCWA